MGIAIVGTGYIQPFTLHPPSSILPNSWLERERDAIAADLDAALLSSPHMHIYRGDTQLAPSASSDSPASAPTASLTTAHTAPHGFVAGAIPHKGKKKAHGPSSAQGVTISRRLSSDINALVAQLSLAEAHFIRCVKPNAHGTPRAFSPPLVLSQLRASGVFEAVELVKSAYPTRLPYASLHGRFASRLPPDLAVRSPADLSEAIALACDVPRKAIALGRTQLFLGPGTCTCACTYRHIGMCMHV